MLKAAVALIEMEVERLLSDCACREVVCPCPACTKAEKLDNLRLEIASMELSQEVSA